MTLCFATNNRHKLEEVRAVVGQDFRLATLQDIGCIDELPETRGTIEGNAMQKAEYVWDHFHVAAFADDSGLEVDALGGAPGVDSAHYAGRQRDSEDNIRLLLKNMESVSDRSGQFRTIIHLILPQGRWSFEGKIRGSVLREKRGAGGFGYDPVFMPEGFSKTLAEMSMEEKNQISHRAVAVKKLAGFLRNLPS